MSWLLHNYFLPTLTPSSTTSSAPSLRLPPIAPLLKQYKSLLKLTSRDASLKARYKADVVKVVRAIERWVGGAKVAAAAVVFSGWGASTSGSSYDDENDSREQDGKERWALDRLCEALLERDGLVPVSAK